MAGSQDIENLEKASQGANLLSQDLEALFKSKNPYLSEIVIDMLKQSRNIESKLERLRALASKGQ